MRATHVTHIPHAAFKTFYPTAASIRRPIMAAVSIAGTGFFREILLELSGLAIHLLGLRQRLLLDRDIRPDGGIFGVDLQPFVEARLGIRLDRLGGTFRFADAAIDAFVGVDDEEILALVEAVDGADFHAIGVFALDAIVGHDIGHEELQDFHADGAGQPGTSRLSQCRRKSVSRLGRQARFRQVVSDVSALSPDFKDKRSAKAAAADRVF